MLPIPPPCSTSAPKDASAAPRDQEGGGGLRSSVAVKCWLRRPCQHVPADRVRHTAGLFIYVGSVGIVSEEFAKYDDEAFSATMPRGARFYMFAALFFGFVVVALLQLVPG